MKKEFVISAIISLVFLTSGFIMIHYGLVNYGISAFVFLPFVLGYILRKSTVIKVSLFGLLASLTLFFILLIAGGKEGLICILMSLPLIGFALILGFIVSSLLKGNKKNKGKDNLIKSSIIPLFLFSILGITENQLTKPDPVVNSVSSEIILPYSSMQVYETIKTVDTLDAEKPFLMKLDLPIPQKCILEEEKVGALRTCYFEGGQIVERVTELEKGVSLKMDVIDYQLTGRKWLGFKEAIYTFEELKNGSCKMTRITTYTSELYPRMYWKPLEEIGIEQEHEYVFRNLKKDLKERFP